MGAMKKITQENPDIVSMSIGEANFDPPDELVESACSMLRDKVTRRSLYTPTRGLPSALRAISRYLDRLCGVSVDPEENILITVGATEALYLAARVLLEPGDKVLAPDPGWGPAAVICSRRGAELVYYPLLKGETWTVDTDAILDRLDESIKLLMINSPSNPTGAMIVSPEDWKRIMDAARKKGVFVISDEVYHAYSFVGPYVSALPHDSTFENLLVVSGFSKAFAIMGWRMGFAVAHPWLIRQMDVYKEAISACTPSIAQWAVGEYLDHCDEYLNQMRVVLKGNMEKMVAGLNAIPGVTCLPAQGGFYLFPDFSAIEPSSAKLAERLLRAGVAIAAGTGFGPHGEGCARLLFSTDWEAIEKALGRIEKELTVSE